MTRLILWRHGQTAWNRANRVQGHADVELTEVGRGQAVAAAPRIATLHPDAIVSSDLRRAKDTAEALAALTGLPVKTDPRLRERFFGEWQGLDHDEIAARWPDAHARWRAGDPDPGCGIEQIGALGTRVAMALRDLATRFPDGTVVAVGHGGAVREGCGHLLGWPPTATRTLGVLGNCHWAELRHDSRRGWQLRAYNLD